MLERCYHGTGCVGDRRHGGSGAQHSSVVTAHQPRSPAFLSTSPQSRQRSVHSTLQPSAISSELCGHWRRVRGSRRGGAAPCTALSAGPRLAGSRPAAPPHTVTPPGLETGAGTSSVIHIHLHTLTHTLVPAPPWLAAPPPAPPPPGCDTGRRKSEQEQQPVIISSYDGVSRGRGQIVT